MADWTLPSSPATPYADHLEYLKDRDLDAAKMFFGLPTNPVTNMIRLERTNPRLQEYLAGAWTDKLLSILGGGTGAANVGDARTNLGLGTIATQNANNVAITGGNISGITFPASVITSGNFNILRMPTGGNWPTLVSELVLSGHATKLAALGLGYRTGGNTTLTDTDYTYVCTGGTVTLPNAIGIPGRVYAIKRNGTSVVIATTAGQTIDGAANLTIAVDKTSYVVQSDGAGWKIISGTGASMIGSIVHYVGALAAGNSQFVDVNVAASGITDTNKAIIIPTGGFGADWGSGSLGSNLYRSTRFQFIDVNTVRVSLNTDGNFPGLLVTFSVTRYIF